MEKFKYIIIFLLTALLGLTYYQLEQYRKISQTLIFENNNLDKTIEELKTQNLKKQEALDVLNDQLKQQQLQIISLQDHLAELLIKEFLEKEGISQESYYDEEVPLMQNSESGQNPDLSIEPDINLNENNEIESIEIKVKKSFDGL